MALSISVYSLYLAVGISCLTKNSLENSLLPSSLEQEASGPKTLKPLFANTSDMPITRGTSGPTTVRSILFSSAKSANLSNSVSFISRQSATDAIPALPGAQ